MDNAEVFQTLNELNVNEFTQKKGNFTYLSWAWAVRELLKVAPKATWQIHKFGEDGERQPYMKTDAGYFVQVTVDVEGVMRTQIHPVLNHRNETIDEPNAFQINTSIQRCLAKAIALHGLGLYIYAGEDLPEVPELSKNQVKEILDMAGEINQKTFDMIAEKVDAREINATNYEASIKRLKEMGEKNE